MCNLIVVFSLDRSPHMISWSKQSSWSCDSCTCTCPRVLFREWLMRRYGFVTKVYLKVTLPPPTPKLNYETFIIITILLMIILLYVYILYCHTKKIFDYTWVIKSKICDLIGCSCILDWKNLISREWSRKIWA